MPGKSQNKQQLQRKPKTIIYLDQTQEKETVYKSIKNKMSKHESGHMVDRLKVKTKKAKSVLGNNSKCQLLRRPDGWCAFQLPIQRNAVHVRASTSEEGQREYNNVRVVGVKGTI